MSEPIVQVDNLSRMFRVYHKPQERLWSAFHLEFIRRPRYREFWALRDVNLKVNAGEKLGIVGRNGAGKSTLLKIICGNLRPTEGRVSVRGNIQALMELGTGFHPDFTGRENIAAFLGYQGIIGKRAQRLQEEVADFSELEEFLDFPVRTYSAGMYARLAFSAATSMEPELLIIDEVLGAGDAYFAGKCVERMRRLTGQGATVLFVSHDLTSVQLLCDRAVWIDGGRLVADGDCLEVSRRYMFEVRREEDQRLRAVSRKIRKTGISTIHRADELHRPMLFHLVADTPHPKQEHLIFRVALKRRDEIVRELRIGDAMDNNRDAEAFVYDDAGFMDWSRPRKIDGCYARAYSDQAGSYNHAPWEFRVPVGQEQDSLTIEIEYFDSGSEEFHVEVYRDDTFVRLGSISSSDSRQTKIAAFPLPPPDEPAPEEVRRDQPEDAGLLSPGMVPSGEGYGSGEGRITSFTFLDEGGRPKHLLENQSRTVARIEYAFTKPVPEPVFVLCIYRADGTCMSQLYCKAGSQWRDNRPMAGSVEAVFDPLLLGRGHYSASIAIFHYLDPADNREPPAYHLINRFYRFQVVQPAGVNMELGAVICPVSWVQSHHSVSAATGVHRS